MTPTSLPSRSPRVARRAVLAGAALGGSCLAIRASSADPARAESSPGSGALTPPVDVARWEEDQYRRFRIPALEQTLSGTLIAAFDGRASMGDLPTPGIGVVLRRSVDEGGTWTPLQSLHAHPTWSGGDPSLLVDRVTGHVLCFFTSSKDAGYAASGTGNDPEDPSITQLDLAVSEDEGLTWTTRRITPEVKDPAWAGMFASSGAGIQLRHGPHAGRLLQQYVVRIDDGNFTVTAYSDDHGETWQHGEPVGPGADENKVSERSDGSVLLNIRVRGRRWQAVSEDGGVTYTAPEAIAEQIDPGCNGDVRRLFPDAAPGSELSRVQVLVNAADPSIRRNLTARVSFDDGATWPASTVLAGVAAASATTVPLGDGRLALLYEREGYSTISARRLDVAALAPSPLVVSLAEGVRVTAGATTEVTLELHNTGTVPVMGARIRIEGEDGITATDASARTVLPGARREITVPLAVPAGLAGARSLSLRSTAQVATTPLNRRGGQVHGDRPAAVTVERPAGAADSPAVTVLPVIDAIYPDETAPGLVGDLAVPWARVRNSGDVPLTALRVSSDGGGSGADIDRLAPGESATVTARDALSRTLTAEDVESGAFAPTITVTAESGAGPVTASATITPLDLTRRPSVAAEGPVALPTGDLRTSALTRVDAPLPAASTLPEGCPLALTLPPGGRTSVQLVVTPPRAGSLEVLADSPAELAGSLVERIDVVAPGGGGTGEVTGDPLTPLPARVVAGEARSLWCTVSLPADAPAGLHVGTLSLRLDGEVLADFPLHLQVRGPRLAPLRERDFVLDLWWHPDAIADAHGLELFSQEHWLACRPYLADLAARGQHVVNAVVTEDPWLIEDGGEEVPQTASHYASQVAWSWDGTRFGFDFSVFDRGVEEHERAGITGPIHLFALLQFRLGERLTYTDTRSGEVVTERVELGDARYREAWGAFLLAMHEHLVERGWWERAALAFDERPRDLMETVHGVVHDVAPMWDGRTALAANSLAEADIARTISFNHSFLAEVPTEVIARRRAAGEPTLFYTFYDPVRPNTVTASPPMSSRMLGWEVVRYDLDGYLRWTYNSWPADVARNPSHRYGQGDEYLVMPGSEGPISTLRWESFRDGLDDAEILGRLRGEDPALLTALLADLRADDAERREAWWAMLTGRESALRALR
jgi:sialidase-1